MDLFLEISHFTDVHFTGKDVAYIISFLVTLLTAWFKLKHDNELQTAKIEELSNRAEKYYNECKEEFLNAKNGRISIRKDFGRKLENLDTEMKQNKENFNNDIKQMNSQISEIKSDTAEIKGMLNTLLNKK